MSVYFEYPPLIIRTLSDDDVMPLVNAEIAQGWHSVPDKLIGRIQDERDGKAVTFCAVWECVPVGYVSLYFRNQEGPFRDTAYPEIVDFNVCEKYRNKGIGSRLLDCAESAAAMFSPVVTLGVGLHAGYGAAQRLYIRRGYIPDGSGVWYHNQPCPPYAMCENGDDLILYLSKSLRS